MSKPVRVLVFSPYLAWRLHANYETTIARACKLRGASIKYVLCDSALAECDMTGGIASVTVKTPEFCDSCRADAKSIIEETGLDYQWLGEFVTADERREIFDWAQSLPPDRMLTAEFRGHPVGAWVTTSVVSHFRSYPIKLDDWNVVGILRGYLQGAAMTVVGLARVYDEWMPDAVLLFNGRRSVLHVAYSLARGRGMRVLVHERGQTSGTVNVIDNETCTSLVPFKRYWAEWGKVPLTRSEIDVTATWLRGRRNHLSKPGMIKFGHQPKGDGAIRRQLDIPDDKTFGVFFTTSSDEFAGDPERQGPFSSQEVFLEMIADWARIRPGVVLAIRTHPSLGGKSGVRRAGDQIAWFDDFKTRMPSNVRLIMPDDEVSSYDVMDAADFAVTYGSTAGLEMFALGKPLGTTPPIPIYDHVPGVVVINGPGEVEVAMDRLASTQPSREFQRQALRCIYQYFYGKQTPFPLVEMTGLFESKLTYTDESALTPGKDPGLDRICDFIVEGKPLYPGPSESDLARSTADEDSFLAEIAINPAWLQPTAEDIAAVAVKAPRTSAKHKVRGALLSAVRTARRTFDVLLPPD